MEKEAFLVVVAAVIAGNFLTGLFAYFLWYGQKMERQGIGDEAWPLWVKLLGLIPLAFAAVAMVSFVS